MNSDTKLKIGIRDVWGGHMPFSLGVADRRQHLYVVGKSGTGKTTLLLNAIIQDIAAGRGVAVIDPHGDLAQEILNHIPTNRADDVVYFDVTTADYPIGLNLLQNVPPERRHRVASELVFSFKSIWRESWGPRMEYILYAAVAALLDSIDGSLLGVQRMLSDPAYRRWVVHQVKDPVVRHFWVEEFENYDERFRREAVAPIENKVGQLLMAPPVRNLLAQVRRKIDARFMMDNRRIFIANLSKGMLGEDKANLLGSLLVSSFQLAAMSRANIPEDDRQDFHLYIDEFHNFTTDSFASILSEARKYRLCLTLSHQYIEQLPIPLRAAVFGNVGIQAASFNNGNLTYLNAADWTTASPTGINDLGQIVGNWKISTSGPPRKSQISGGFLYSNGTVTDLGSLGGGNTQALAINNLGAITGSSQLAGPGPVTHAFLYTGGTMTDLGDVGRGGYSQGSAINDAGQITGYSVSNGQFYDPQPFLYSAGAMQDLGSATGEGYGVGINSTGEIAGYTYSGYTSFSYRNGSVTPIGGLTDENGFGVTGLAAAINNSGEVVGLGSGGGPGKAFAYTPGSGIQDLNSLIPNNSGWILHTAVALNNVGQIVGSGELNGVGHSFLLTPHLVTVPSPQPLPSDVIHLNTISTTQLEVFKPGTGFQQGGPINPNWPTIVFTHGFNSSAAQWNSLAAQWPNAENGINLLAWDWSSDAGSILEPWSLGQATSRTQSEGRVLGEALVAALGSNYNQKIQFVGHSLGTLVNAQAINVFNSHTGDSANTQDTLFDNAEIANVLAGNPPAGQWAIDTPTSDHVAAIDNYVSAFGNLIEQNNATNIILTQHNLDPFSFHGYPQNWYQSTLPANNFATVGYPWSIMQGNDVPVGQYFVQEPASSLSLSLQLVNQTQAEDHIQARDAAESLIYAAGGGYFLGGNGLNSVVQTSGHVTGTFTEEVGGAIGAVSQGLKFVFGSAIAASGGLDASIHSLASVASPTPSYAWLPITIPENAGQMSFNFEFNGVDPSDYLAVGINDTQLFALEGQFVADGTMGSSGLLDVSMWQGQDVQLFIYDSGIANGGTMTVQDIEFFTVPEPATSALLVPLLFGLLARRPRIVHC